MQCSAVWKAYLRHNLAPLGGIVTPVTLSANLTTTDLLITIIVNPIIIVNLIIIVSIIIIVTSINFMDMDNIITMSNNLNLFTEEEKNFVFFKYFSSSLS